MTPPPTPAAGLVRARGALAAAHDNVKNGHFGAAVNRAYYATLYASLALLASIGIDAKSHEGVRTLVSQHFVRAGSLPVETSRRLARIAADRAVADYDLAVEVTQAEANETIASAARYVDDVAALLAAAP